MISKKLKRLEEELINSYARYEHILLYGAGDPFWPDGTNLYLVRNHIIYYKQKMKELNYYPKIYFRRIPKSLPMDYDVKNKNLFKE